ncbi:unknown [Clostridium sp. CAG:575]|nr:unknown [Clostridium sp. CAG:575]
MFIFNIIFILIIINFLFFWSLLIGSNKFKTNQEKYMDDILQMEFLKKF